MIFTARPKPTRKTTAVVINIPENSVKSFYISRDVPFFFFSRNVSAAIGDLLNHLLNLKSANSLPIRWAGRK